MQWVGTEISHPMELETTGCDTEHETSDDISTVGQWEGAGRNDIPFRSLAPGKVRVKSSVEVDRDTFVGWAVDIVQQVIHAV